MRTLEELTDAIDQYADRGTPRGAAEVFNAATLSAPTVDSHHRRGTRATAAALAAVAVLLVGAVIVVRSLSASVNVDTTPPAGPVVTAPPATSALPTIEVPNGAVHVVRGAFGRVWVVTRDTDITSVQSRLRSFDPVTGKMLSDASIAGSVLDVGGFAVSDAYLWLRASTGGPASFPLGKGGEGDNAIYRVDPTSGAADPVAYLNGDGPVAASGQRVAAADASKVFILDGSGQRLAETTVDEAVGVSSATLAGTNGIVGLAFSSGSRPALYGLHQGRGELLELDPDTGHHIATQALDGAGGQVGPGMAAGTGHVWIARSDGAVLGIAVPLQSPPSASTRFDGLSNAQLHAIDDGHLAAWSPTTITIITVAGMGRDQTQIPTGRSGDLVTLDERVWIATWPAGEPTGSTLISLEPGPSPGETTNGTTQIPSVIGQPLRDAQTTLAKRGLIAVVDDRLDSTDPAATVVAQEPGPVGTAPKGSAVGLRTAAPVPADASQCASSRQPRSGTPDVLPAAGATDLDRVRAHAQDPAIKDAYPSVTRMYLAHRDGDVWDGTDPTSMHRAQDYWLVLEVPNPSDCPPDPPMFDGIPLVFVTQTPTDPSSTTPTTSSTATTGE